MNLFEYQAKTLLRAAGLPAPEGVTVSQADEIPGALARVPGPPWVVKAQIKAGGRGKAGGVKIVETPGEAEALTANLLGKPLVTHQTGPQGLVVNRILVEPARPFTRELYLSILLDRSAGLPVVLASREGGVEIEKLAVESPEKLVRVRFDPRDGLPAFSARAIAKALGLTGPLAAEGVRVLTQLARFFVARDCSLLEINPLVISQDGHLVLLDAKVSLDDNALARHADLGSLRAEAEEDAREAAAAAHGLSYISLTGSVGCMVNGAGLAMATLDILKLHGGMPANFLDVGGGATKDTVVAAFKILLADPKVKAVLVNIFGGIMKCDVIAQGMVDAFRELRPSVPVIVRLEGTNKDLGVKILEGSGLTLTAARGFAEAAQLAVAAAR